MRFGSFAAMSTDRADELTAMRRRIFDLWSWFGEDVDRLSAAQARWREARCGPDDDALWRRRVEREVDRWLAALASPPRFAELSPDRPAEIALLELEALDRIAAQWLGPKQYVPPPLFGSGERARYVVPLGRERRPRTASQGGVLYTHLRNHALVPPRVVVPARPAEIPVRVKTVENGFEHALARAALGVATTSFEDGATLEWHGERAASIRGGDDRASELWTALQAAALNGFDLLVAPELTVTPAARQWIVRQLRWGAEPSGATSANRFPLLVPGSFHEQVDGRFVHRAVLLDGVGNTLAEHHKLVPYGVFDHFMEDIQLGDSITLLVTPIGTVAIAICKNLCDDHVGTIWDQVQPEWLLVPAYGRGRSAHATAAKRLHRMLGTVTVLAHQGDATQEAAFESFIHADSLYETHCNAPNILGAKIPLLRPVALRSEIAKLC